MAAVTSSEKERELTMCYLCRKPVDIGEAIEVPLTTGDKVYTHKSCLDLYIQQTTASACGSCSSGTGSSACSSCSVNQ